MSVAALEQTLRDLPKVGTLVKDRPYRQVWRFEVAGKGRGPLGVAMVRALRG